MNWGNKILLIFLGFAAIMFTLVYKSYHTKTELVTREYYKDELAYQKVINGSRNATGLKEAIKIDQNGKKLTLHFPGETAHEEISGDVWLYCAYDSERDLRFPLKMTTDGVLLFDQEKLKPGQYSLKVNLYNRGTHYFIEQQIIIEP